MKELAPGTTIGAYVVERWLDRGGVASVYLGRHVRLGAAYVLKLLHRPSPAILPRLLLEGQLQSRLAHPNVLSVFDLLEWRGNPVLVLEYVDGPNLDELLRLRRLELDQVDELATGILRGVSAAHRFGLVHRDLKPSNILLARYDHALVPKIADFGLAKVLDTDPGEVRTRTGQVFGTPSYMSPEQFVNAAAVDVRSDIFALGCILYEMVSGQRAYTGTDIFAVNRKILEGDRRPLSTLREDVPERMVRAIDRCLQVRRADRYDSCEELLAAWRSSMPEEAPVWLRPANSVARLTISHDELDTLRERRKSAFADASKSSIPDPMMDHGDSHVSPERLAAPALGDDDARHLASCVRCRVARMQLQRAEDDFAASPDSRSRSPEAPRITEVQPPGVPVPPPLVSIVPVQEVVEGVVEDDEGQDLVVIGPRRRWIAMAVLMPLAAAIGFVSVFGLVGGWWWFSLGLGHQPSDIARLADPVPRAPDPVPQAPDPVAQSPDPVPQAPDPVPQAEPAPAPPSPPPTPTRAKDSAERRSRGVPTPPPLPADEDPQLAAPPPPPKTASWVEAGDAKAVWLLDDSSIRFKPGDPLKPGRYRIIASFSDYGEVKLDWIRVAAGEERTVECFSALAKCRAR